MNPPVASLQRLTLEDMLSTAAQSLPPGDGDDSKCRDQDYDSEDSDLDSNDTSADGEGQAHVRSPTRLIYNLEALPETTKSAVRDAFNEPPAMNFQHCREMEDTYAFQMTEVVTRSVRICAPSSGKRRLSCSCDHSGQEGDGEACRHVLWLLDQVAKQTLYDNSHDVALTMTAAGYPLEMGDPFQKITEHHLNILADGLHCRLVDPERYNYNNTDEHRVKESRELLSNLYQTPPDTFRPDIFQHPVLGPSMIKPKDLEYTVFRMLVDDDHFFHYFLSHMARGGGGGTTIDFFRQLTHRIDAVLHGLDKRTSPLPAGELDPEQEFCTVAWAARHVVGVVDLVRYRIWSHKRPLRAAEKDAAAKILVHVLEAVVRRNRDYHTRGRRGERNLYLRLIGDTDNGFVVEELWIIPEGVLPYVDAIEGLIEEITVQGAPVVYVTRLRKLVAHVRARGVSANLKRQSQQGQEDSGNAAKRMK